MDSKTKKTVYVAISGGVDSSVVAALLKSQNFNVIGVFFKPWSPQSEELCNWREDREMALRVCAKLDVEFETWDFTKEYGDKVVKYMINGYRHGLTPNPDVMCNKEIKFGLFLKKALTKGADFIATGHYVRLQKKLPIPGSGSPTSYRLLKGIDKNKDQSYFLWTLTQKQLKYCLFPIGDYTKPEVRKLAKKFGLPNYDKKDSQGICFIGQLNIKDFLKTRIHPRTGEIRLVETGQVIGQHDGVFYYTIGQRHGLNIGLGSGPYFVCDKDIGKNTIYVTREIGNYLNGREAKIRETNWISEKSKLPSKLRIKTRYRSYSNPAIIVRKRGDSLTVKFLKPEKAITPGQSAVFYQGEEVLGGGIIT